ncbi:nucleotide exchange factor GrpE [Gaopeijia maritima]|uniref:Protein GrpE n=1 Tax=Gaopeijia maritima TaxID=3119007 RepID=A0ABU9EBZ4_9BACT
MTDPTANETPDLPDLDETVGSDPVDLPDASEDAAGPTPDEVERTLVADEVSDLRRDFEELNDRHMRLVAEFANFRRREAEERTGTWDRAQADLVRRFLDVLDDLQRVALLDPADEAVTVQSIVEGIDLVERKFHRALEESGAELLEPEEGSAFDPEKMEAMMRVPVEDEALDDTVAGVFARGYLFRGHLVRPARVSVHKAD